MFTLDNFYKSRKWEQLRLQLILERRNDRGEVICEHCKNPIVHKYDTIGHHIEELTPANVNDFNISLNPSNIALVHLKCHNRIHKRFNGQISNADKKVYIVYGSPCSGKTTFVRENMEAGDIVIDIDELWRAVSFQEEYIKPNELKENVLVLHSHLLEQVKMRIGKWSTAWVVGSYPNLMDRVRLSNELGAKLIHIDTDKENCLSNLLKRNNNGDILMLWEKYIKDYWDKYIPDIPPTD